MAPNVKSEGKIWPVTTYCQYVWVSDPTGFENSRSGRRPNLRTAAPTRLPRHDLTRNLCLMKRFAAFIGIGSFFATVEEFLTVVVLKHDVASYVFTLLILFPVFLTLVFLSSKLLDKLWQTEAGRELAHFCTYGCVGLMIEWFIIGLSPWSNPDANPFLMLGFQLGMFSFWATVAFAPRLFLASNESARRAGKSIVMFYVPYFILVYGVGLSVPAHVRFVTVILLVIAGYLIVNVFFVIYFVRVFTARRRACEFVA